jgi:hypothetical protein
MTSQQTDTHESIPKAIVGMRAEMEALKELIAQARAKFDTLTPEQKREHHDAASWR